MQRICGAVIFEVLPRTMIYLTVTCLVAHGQGALILIRISRFLRASVSEAYGKVYLGNADRHL